MISQGYYETGDGLVRVYRVRGKKIYFEDCELVDRVVIDPKGWKFLGQGIKFVEGLRNEIIYLIGERS